MENIDCLNCETNFSGNYCPNCAQRASTRRYSWGYVFSKDFVAENFNFDRGFLLTLLHLTYRPGHLINEYLQGKRKKYFNAIGLLLVLLAIEAILWSIAQNSVADVLAEGIRDQLSANNPDFDVEIATEDIEFMLASQKFIFLIAVPAAAFFSWLILKRMGYNFLEHCIAIIFLLAMNTWLGFLPGFLGLFPMSMETFKVIYFPLSFVVLFFDLLLIWQFSKKVDYSRWGRIWRVSLTMILVISVIALSQQFTIGFHKGFQEAQQPDQTEIAE